MPMPRRTPSATGPTSSISPVAGTDQLPSESSGGKRPLSRDQLAAFAAEDGRRRPLPFRELVQAADTQHAKAVGHAAREVDGGRIGTIASGTAHFAHLEAEVEALREHLRVEDEVVRVLRQRQRLDD